MKGFPAIGWWLGTATIACSVVALIFVAKITEIGGAGYRWEYIPPLIMLAFGVWRIMVYARKGF